MAIHFWQIFSKIGNKFRYSNYTVIDRKIQLQQQKWIKTQELTVKGYIKHLHCETRCVPLESDVKWSNTGFFLRYRWSWCQARWTVPAVSRPSTRPCAVILMWLICICLMKLDLNWRTARMEQKDRRLQHTYYLWFTRKMTL